MRRNLILAIIACCLLSLVHAQQTAVFTHDLQPYNKALELYKGRQFLAAQQLFRSVGEQTQDLNLKGDCAYYIADCAVRLNQLHADELMEAFVQQYPTSLKRNDAYIKVADFYFNNGQYAYAQKWYDKVDPFSLSAEGRERFYFNNAYTFFKNKRYEEARQFFARVENSAIYGSEAKYYLGYMAYQKDEYQQANELFEQVGGNERYNNQLSYYQADMNFKLGNFEKAIQLGLEQYEQLRPVEKSEVAKIIGESYFNLERYQAAIPYLQAFRGRAGKWTNTDYYQFGYAYYKVGDYSKAVGEFNKIVDGQDGVAQNAYYHLAESYLNLGEKQQALNAFKNASEMSFSPEIKKDAALNYAKLSYEIGNSYQPVPEVIRSFIEAYPDDQANAGLKELLVDSYLSSRNFKEALLLLEDDRELASAGVFQKVAFYRGVEVYNEEDFRAAKDLFERSLTALRDPYFVARATYWKAEAAYMLSLLDEALEGFLSYKQLPGAESTPEFENLDYQIGYVHFKQKAYQQAIAAFSDAVAVTSDAAVKRDAYLRLGDSYFVSSKYWPALEQYNEALGLKGPDADYATFQKALCYGFVDRSGQKIEILERFETDFPASIYRDDALYELGNTYLNSDQGEQALASYQELEQRHPSSSYLPKALLKKALIYNNTERETRALEVFKIVAARYPSSNEALEAVSSAKLIYIDRGEVAAYADWVSTLDFVQVADAEIDNAAWQAAEQPYLENKKEVATRRLEDYIRDFPEGRHALKAHYFFAGLLFEKADPAALQHYLYVIAKDQNEFSEQSLVRASEIYLQKEQYDQALPLLVQLEEIADFRQNLVFAQTNSMKAAYQLKDYRRAYDYAEKVLGSEKIDTGVRNDAQVFLARSAVALGEDKKARMAYETLGSNASGSLAAEALYYRAYFLAKDRDYEASNALVQQLAQKYSGYKEFGARGLVLMAKNFYALEDAFQATYILESVITNFPQFPDIVAEASTELELIKASEAKTNASVQLGEN